MGRNVKIWFSDGAYISASYSSKKINEHYEFKAGDLVKVEPCNPLKKRNRGRFGRLTGGHNKNMLARIDYTDEKGSYGYVDAVDLIPFAES